MASRKKIGLLFPFEKSWAGGHYYILNIINSLNALSKDQQPLVTIFYRGKSNDLVPAEVNYPRLRFLPIDKELTFCERVVNFIYRKFYKQPLLSLFYYRANTVDYIFPCISAEYDLVPSLKLLRKIYWIPDFQHLHLPHFFSKTEIELRNQEIGRISALNCTLVLSSQDARSDFEKFYPVNNVAVKVIPFATVLPKYDHLDMNMLRQKYQIEHQSYFIAPNQFWAHKNHIVIIKAMNRLIKQGVDCALIFTGKEDDYRNPDYIKDLKSLVNNLGLTQFIKFLGFIDRADQLKLMQQAVAVVQPSLFEGWSTVVEDTKAVNNFLILSDINVHREQCGHHAVYFNPESDEELASHMSDYIKGINKIPFTEPYVERVVEFASAMIQLTNDE